MAQHYYSNTSVATQLSVAIGTGDTTIQVPESASDNNWPTGQGYPFTIALDYGTVGVELVDVTGKGGLAGAVRTWTVTRAQDLTVASAHAASVPNSIRHVMTRRDLIEARQARMVQPADGTNTYILGETINNTEYVDSLIGDLIYKAASGKKHRFGMADLPQSLLTVGSEGVVSKLLPLYAQGGFARGNGQSFGTNYVSQSRAATWTLTGSANTWIDLGFDTNNALVADDGTMYSSPNFISRAAGLYIFGVIVGFPQTTGSVGVRWVTQGGTILTSNIVPAPATANPISVFGMTNLPGAGYFIKAQAWASVTGAMTASSSSSPKTGFFAQVL